MMNLTAANNIIVYALFPGQKIFIEVYHPQKAFNNIKMDGPKWFMITISPTITVHLQEKGKCFSKGDGNDLIRQAHIHYGKW